MMNREIFYEIQKRMTDKEKEGMIISKEVVEEILREMADDSAD